MMALLSQADYRLFSVALLLVVAIGILEIVAMLFGASMVDGLDDWLTPHTDVPAADVDSSISRLLNWFRLGEVPVLMLLVLFCACFGVNGICLQSISSWLWSHTLPHSLAVPIAFMLSVPCYRVGSGVMARYMPKDETTAVHASSLVGLVAHITLGTATATLPAEAKVRDKFGYHHYIRVKTEPDSITDLKQGEAVLLISYHDGVYTAIHNPNPHLQDV
jgi:hypothetical protein